MPNAMQIESELGADLAGLKSDVGEDVARAILELLFVQSPIDLATLRRAIITQDRETLEKRAVTLESAAAGVGARPLVRLCAELREAAARRLLNSAAVICQELTLGFVSFERQFRSAGLGS